MNTLTSQPPPKILCLDDDPAVPAVIATRLTPLGAEVCSAFFGTQGIWLAVTERPDVIISDVRMPNGNGRHVVECLKERRDTRDIPIIVLTGLRDEKTRRSMLALGADHFLRKPLDFAELLAVLRLYVPLAGPGDFSEPDISPLRGHEPRWSLCSQSSCTGTNSPIVCENIADR
jgi:CheY-like chemotaxis protein